MSSELLIKEYRKIKEYLIEFSHTRKEYEKYLEHLYGISPYHKEIQSILKNSNLEDEYKFFGKVLIRLTATTTQKGSRNRLGDLIDNPDNFRPIVSEKDYNELKIKFEGYSTMNNTASDIINSLNTKAQSIFKCEDLYFKEEHIEGLFDKYDPEVSLSIIIKLEEALKKPFANRDKENKKEFLNVAALLKKITGISKSLKGQLKKNTTQKEESPRWKTNQDRLNLKTL